MDEKTKATLHTLDFETKRLVEAHLAKQPFKVIACQDNVSGAADALWEQYITDMERCSAVNIDEAEFTNIRTSLTAAAAASLETYSSSTKMVQEVSDLFEQLFVRMHELKDSPEVLKDIYRGKMTGRTHG